MPQPRKTAAWVAVCCALLVSVEGLRTTPYLDVGGVPTDCVGETKGVKMSDRSTVQQCLDKLNARVESDFGPGVDACIHHALPPKRKAAYVSFAYNNGIDAFCKSSVARKENAGDTVGACNAMLAYDKVRINGVLVVSKGLDNRRKKEVALCLEENQ